VSTAIELHFDVLLIPSQGYRDGRGRPIREQSGYFVIPLCCWTKYFGHFTHLKVSDYIRGENNRLSERQVTQPGELSSITNQHINCAERARKPAGGIASVLWSLSHNRRGYATAMQVNWWWGHPRYEHLDRKWVMCKEAIKILSILKLRHIFFHMQWNENNEKITFYLSFFQAKWAFPTVQMFVIQQKCREKHVCSLS